MAAELAESPERATALGIDGHDDRLSDLSAAGFARRAAADDRWAERFSALESGGLTDDQQIDRDLVLSLLRGRSVMRDWEVWRRGPGAYPSPGPNGGFQLFLFPAPPG